MNRTQEIIHNDDGSIYLVMHTDGEPSDLFWVWELDKAELDEYFNGRVDLERITREDADKFANDESILIDSDYYNNGKEPIYGLWYAPLTMEQIEELM